MKVYLNDEKKSVDPRRHLKRVGQYWQEPVWYIRWLREHSHMTCFWAIFDLPTYPNQISSDVAWPTYLPQDLTSDFKNFTSLIDGPHFTPKSPSKNDRSDVRSSLTYPPTYIRYRQMQLDIPTYLKIWRHMWMLPYSRTEPWVTVPSYDLPYLRWINNYRLLLLVYIPWIFKPLAFST
jgi:hypothetical protein